MSKLLTVLLIIIGIIFAARAYMEIDLSNVEKLHEGVLLLIILYIAVKEWENETKH
jgi:hypothetical protein